MHLDECLSMWRYSAIQGFSALKTYSVCCFFYILFGLSYYLRARPIPIFLSSFFGAIFILLVIQLISLYQTKSRVRKIAQTAIDKYKANAAVTFEIGISDDSIRYSDPEIFMEIKWSAISHYIHYKNYIFFFQRNAENPVLSMNKNNIQQSIEKELFMLINSKVSELK